MEQTVNEIFYHSEVDQQDISRYASKELEVYEGRVQLIVEGTWALDVLEGPWENLQRTGVKVTKGLHVQVRFNRPNMNHDNPQKPKCDLRTLLYTNPEDIQKIYSTFEVEKPEELMGKPMMIYLDDIVGVGISKK